MEVEIEYPLKHYYIINNMPLVWEYYNAYIMEGGNSPISIDHRIIMVYLKIYYLGYQINNMLIGPHMKKIHSSPNPMSPIVDSLVTLLIYEG